MKKIGGINEAWTILFCNIIFLNLTFFTAQGASKGKGIQCNKLTRDQCIKNTRCILINSALKKFPFECQGAVNGCEEKYGHSIGDKCVKDKNCKLYYRDECYCPCGTTKNTSDKNSCDCECGGFLPPTCSLSKEKVEILILKIKKNLDKKQYLIALKILKPISNLFDYRQHFYRARAFKGMEKYSMAFKEINKAITFNPDHLPSLYNRACYSSLKGDSIYDIQKHLDVLFEAIKYDLKLIKKFRKQIENDQDLVRYN